MLELGLVSTAGATVAEASGKGAVFNSIVVALDLVSNVHRALPVARSLAEFGNLPIQLMSVSAPWMSEEIDAYKLERLVEDHGFSPHSCMIDHDDDAGRAIARHVNTSEGSLLVMATTAKAPVRRHFLGAVTESVLAGVDGPVLLVGPNVAATCSLNSPTLVACVDSTDTADAALPVIAEWVRTFGGGRPCCAEVIPPVADDWSDVRAASRLGYYAARLTEYGVDASWKVLHGDDPMAWLEDFAETVDEAVLVASSAHWTDWDTHWHSATRCLVHTTPRPVLVVPPRRAAAVSSEADPTLMVGAAQ
jgi:nucleotide-binding universal stress UspA family protein